MQVGYGLIPLVDEGQDGELLERIRALRRQFAQEMGAVIPPIHIRDNLQLKPGGYAILVKGVEIARGDLMVGYLLALHPGETLSANRGDSHPGAHFQSSRPVDTGVAQGGGPTPRVYRGEPGQVVATHLSEIMRSNCDELLGRQEVQKLLDRLAKTHPKVVEELVPGTLSLGVIQKVLQNLLRERVSIRDLLTVMETLADYGSYSKDPDVLTEYVRQRLGRALSKSLETSDHKILVYSLDPFIEDLIKDSLQKTEYGVYLAMAPETAEEIVQALKAAVDKSMSQNLQPAVVCSPAVRRHLRRLIERHLPNLWVCRPMNW